VFVLVMLLKHVCVCVPCAGAWDVQQLFQRGIGSRTSTARHQVRDVCVCVRVCVCAFEHEYVCENMSKCLCRT